MKPELLSRIKAEILTHVRGALALFEKHGESEFNCYSKDNPFRTADAVQVVGFLRRLENTHVDQGISEYEASLLSRLATVSQAHTFKNSGGESTGILYNDENPFLHLLRLLTQYGLVSKHSIHIEIHPVLPLPDKPVEIDSELLGSVYDALHTRIDRMAEQGNQGALFLQNIISKAASNTSRGKLEAVMQLLELGAADDLRLAIFSNTHYQEALRDAQERAVPASVIEKVADEIDPETTSERRVGRRSFFRDMVATLMAASLATAVDPVTEEAARRGGMPVDSRQRVDEALTKIKAGINRTSDADLRKILEEVAQEPPAHRMTKDMVTGGLAWYLMRAGENGQDPLGIFLQALASECDHLAYPLFQFGTKSRDAAAITK